MHNTIESPPKEGISEIPRDMTAFTKCDNCFGSQFEINQNKSGENANNRNVGLLKRPNAKSDPTLNELL